MWSSAAIISGLLIRPHKGLSLRRNRLEFPGMAAVLAIRRPSPEAFGKRNYIAGHIPNRPDALLPGALMPSMACQLAMRGLSARRHAKVLMPNVKITKKKAVMRNQDKRKQLLI